MNKFIQAIAMVVFAAFSITASVAYGTRIIAQEEDAYELPFGEVSLPGSTAGTAIFKPCDDCKTQSMRVTHTTVYQVHGRMVSYVDFMAAAEEYRKRDGGASNTAIYLFYNIKSRRITRIGMDYFG
jgi:hypothetical protein